jgi:Na+-translocating ferredoxin:NAD+ oxidoreductase RnfC subunit
MPNDKKPVHTLIVNGCECEPYLTSDYRLMLEAPEPIITGALLAGRSVGADRIVIGVEDNKMARGNPEKGGSRYRHPGCGVKDQISPGQ